MNTGLPHQAPYDLFAEFNLNTLRNSHKFASNKRNETAPYWQKLIKHGGVFNLLIKRF